MLSRLKYAAYGLGCMLAVPVLVHAQIFPGGDTALEAFGLNIVLFINQVLVPFVFAVALLLFIYGAFLYFIQGGGDDEKRRTGRSYMVWAIIAFVIMVSVWGIVNLIAGGIGLREDTLDGGLIPDAPTR